MSDKWRRRGPSSHYIVEVVYSGRDKIYRSLCGLYETQNKTARIGAWTGSGQTALFRRCYGCVLRLVKKDDE